MRSMNSNGAWYEQDQGVIEAPCEMSERIDLAGEEGT